MHFDLSWYTFDTSSSILVDADLELLLLVTWLRRGTRARSSWPSRKSWHVNARMPNLSIPWLSPTSMLLVSLPLLSSLSILSVTILAHSFIYLFQNGTFGFDNESSLALFRYPCSWSYLIGIVRRFLVLQSRQHPSGAAKPDVRRFHVDDHLQ